VSRVEVTVVGGSWGGMDALSELLTGLDPVSSMAIVVALHRAANAPHGALLSLLRTRCPVPVSEPDDKDPVEPGRLYLAPADYHLLLEPGRFALSIDAPVRCSRPSIDVLFQSAADSYGDRTAAVVLSGSNNDGCRGLREVKDRGGTTLVQEPSTAVRREMPDAAIATGAVDQVLPLLEIAAVLNRLARVP
jgi:two-component system chemotaxis response regulator CheB